MRSRITLAGPKGDLPELNATNMGAWFVEHWLSLREYRKISAFFALLFFTAAVSVHDAVLVVLNHDVIAEVERNPVGRWLIELNGGDVWLFVMVKLFGTALCASALVALYRVWRQGAEAVVWAVAGFQLGLLLYLSLA